MGKRILLNVWLAIALLVLVWVVWKEPGHAPKPPEAKLTAMSPAAVTKIVISNHNGSITLSKQGAAWRMSQPVEVAANGVRVDDAFCFPDCPPQPGGRGLFQVRPGGQ